MKPAAFEELLLSVRQMGAIRRGTLKPARVTVVLKDGRSSTHACESHRGDFNRPFEDSELRAKFRELAGLVLTPEGVAKVEQMVDHAERWTSVRELPQLLRRFGRL